jgi:hypothetical protein
MLWADVPGHYGSPAQDRSGQNIDSVPTVRLNIQSGHFDPEHTG